jgi:hypothetical protein
MEGEFITVEMSVTNCMRDYEMRCTPIIRVVERASRNKKIYTDHAQRIIALCDVKMMDYKTSEHIWK